MITSGLTSFPNRVWEQDKAIEAYTLTSAYDAFQEKDCGSLEAGKLANLVVLSRDILDTKERDHIAETEVVMTVVGGKIVSDKQK